MRQIDRPEEAKNVDKQDSHLRRDKHEVGQDNRRPDLPVSGNATPELFLHILGSLETSEIF